MNPPDVDPPSSPVPRWPVTFSARWHRNWRLTPEIVDRGILQLKEDGLFVTGRRTHPLRAALWFVARFAWTLVALAVLLAVTMTGFGISWRAEQCIWLLLLPTVTAPALLMFGAGYRAIVRAILEPSVSLVIPWDAVRSIVSDGRQVEIDALTTVGRLRGRFTAPKSQPAQKLAIRALCEGRLPGGRGGTFAGWMRPPWVDRLVLGAGVAGTVWGAVSLEHRLSAWMLSEETESGPLAGIPDALTGAQLEARVGATCTTAPEGGPQILNARDGQHLTWSTPRPAEGWSVSALRWPAGAGRFDVVASGAGQTGREQDVLADDGSIVGVTAAVPAAAAAEVAALLATGDVESLHAAWCAGLIGPLDFTRVVQADPPRLAVRRDGDDLIVTASHLGDAYRVLPVRWRPGPAPDLFDLCEVPQRDGQVGSQPATPLPRRFAHFFRGADDQARVYLVRADRFDQVNERLGRGGTAQRCLVPDSLTWGGLAAVQANTSSRETAASFGRLRERAARVAGRRRLPSKPEALGDALISRYQDVRAAIPGVSGAQSEALTLGFLDAVTWTTVFEVWSMEAHSGELERVRQRLDQVDPERRAGGDFLLATAQAFTERIPARRSTWDRVILGDTWTELEAGKPMTPLVGPPIAISEAGAATWLILGRYLMMDAARQLEDDLDAGRLGLLGTWTSLGPELLLASHKITLDVRKSSKRKLVEAWLTGNFEYIADRLLQKAAEQLGSPHASLQAIRADRFTIETEWTDGAAVRMSALSRSGQRIGWLAQLDASAVKLHFGARDAVPSRGRVVAMAASYVDNNDRPTGFAASEGRVTNYTLTPKLGGLAILGGSANGVTLLDLRKGGRLPGDDHDIRPLHSLRDFDHLQRWLRDHGASAFQTHALFADGERRIDADRAAPDVRERRLLVDARFGQNPIVVVVDLPGVPKGYTLHESMEIAVQALQTPEPEGPGLTVRGIANLDVGSFDVLRAWDTAGRELRSSRVALDQANNLIVITR